MFLSELFSDEGDLGWLIPLGELLQAEYPDSWTNIVTNTLHTLKLRRSEEFVQGLYKRTSEQKRLPIEVSTLLSRGWILIYICYLCILFIGFLGVWRNVGIRNRENDEGATELSRG